MSKQLEKRRRNFQKIQNHLAYIFQKLTEQVSTRISLAKESWGTLEGKIYLAKGFGKDISLAEELCKVDFTCQRRCSCLIYVSETSLQLMKDRNFQINIQSAKETRETNSVNRLIKMFRFHYRKEIPGGQLFFLTILIYHFRTLLFAASRFICNS